MRSKKNNINKKQNKSKKKQLGGASMDGSINPNLELFVAEIAKLDAKEPKDEAERERIGRRIAFYEALIDKITEDESEAKRNMMIIQKAESEAKIEAEREARAQAAAAEAAVAQEEANQRREEMEFRKTWYERQAQRDNQTQALDRMQREKDIEYQKMRAEQEHELAQRKQKAQENSSQFLRGTFGSLSDTALKETIGLYRDGRQHQQQMVQSDREHVQGQARLQLEHDHKLQQTREQMGKELIGNAIQGMGAAWTRRQNQYAKEQEFRQGEIRNARKHAEALALQRSENKQPKASKGGSPKKKILKSGSPVNLKK